MFVASFCFFLENSQALKGSLNQNQKRDPLGSLCLGQTHSQVWNCALLFFINITRGFLQLFKMFHSEQYMYRESGSRQNCHVLVNCSRNAFQWLLHSTILIFQFYSSTTFCVCNQFDRKQQSVVVPTWKDEHLKHRT